jgi:hypothetical protein
MKCGLPTGVLSGSLSMHRCVLDLDGLDGGFVAMGTVPTQQGQDAPTSPGDDADSSILVSAPAGEDNYVAVTARPEHEQNFASDDEDQGGKSSWMAHVLTWKMPRTSPPDTLG